MENSYKEKIIEKYAGGGEVHRAEQTGQFADMVADSEYATSLSNHALFICQK